MNTIDQEELESHSRLKRPVYDDVFEHVCSFGTYQLVIWVAFLFLLFPLNAQFTALVFVMGTPHFRCATPNVTCLADQCCANCTRYEFDGDMTTTVTEWNLVCDRAYLGATLQSCYFVGMLVGSFTTGILSDAWGRKKCMFLSYAIMLVSGVFSALVDCMSLFGFLRFLVGLSLTGTMLSSYVFLMEMVGPRSRTLIATIGVLQYITADTFYVLMAYVCRDWRSLLLIYTVPAILLLVCWRYIPESPRWLVAQGRLDEAYDVIMKYGPKKDRKTVDTDSLRTLLGEIREAQTDQEKNAKKHTPLDTLRTRKMRKRTFVLAYQWFSVALLGFGTYIFVSQLAGDIYVNYVIYAFAHAITIPIQYFLLKKIGRRSTHAASAITACVMLFIMLAVYKGYPLVTTGLAMVGSVIGAITWTTVYLMTAELFPTVLRNIGLGTGSTSARVGAVLSPFVAMSVRLPGMTLALPVTIFAVVALLNGLLSFCLPETLFAKMHQTIEEAEAAEDYYGLVCCGKTGDESTERVRMRQEDVEEPMMSVQ